MPQNPSSGDEIKADFPVIEGCTVIELLGRGGMASASVWKARQVSSGRLVAVKILSENYSRNPACVNRLKADIKLVTGLKHEGIAQTYELGQLKTTGCYYLVSEYVSGYSMGEWLRWSGQLAESDALVVAHFVANALRLAWNKARLIHGAIRPANIMIDDEGATKVADLGLAQALRIADALDDQKPALRPDALAYMSPEMVSGEAAPDCRSDIYSLGATLHHMLTGKAPSGASAPAVAGGLPPEVVADRLQPALPGLTIGSARLIRKMMSPAPGDRYQKWEEVIADLTRLERDEPQAPAQKDAAAAAPGPGAAAGGAVKPILVKAAAPSGAKPSRAGQPAMVVAKKKGAHVPGGPAGMPKLKRPAASFLKSARRSLYIAAAFHVLLLLVAGTVIISRVFFNRETNFVGQPPPMRSFEPRKLEHQVKVQKRQRSSSRPSMAPRLVAMKASSFALPEIKVDSKSVKTSFSPKFAAVSGGVGMGVGLGTGYGLGGFGQGVSAFDFFGIKGRADRVVMLVDVSESMVDDIRDGVAGYQRVKEKIGRVIDELSEQALFNVIVFADAAGACSTNLMIASAENKQKAKQWLAPFNSQGNLGLVDGNLQQSALGVQAVGGSTRLDLALTGAFEQGADTILVISDGLPRIRKALTEQQQLEWDERVMQWERENAVTLKARNKAIAIAEHDKTVETKVWVPGTKREEGRPATEGHYEIRRGWDGHYNLPALTPRPVPPEYMLWWSLTDCITHFTLLNRELYEKKGGKKAPVINCIGYCIDDAGGDFLKGLAKYFKGNYRRVGGRAKTENPEQSAVKYPKTSRSKKPVNPPKITDPNAP